MLYLESRDWLQSEFKSLKHVHQLLPIDKFDWGRTIARSFSSGFCGKRTSRNNDALVGAASHRAAKITDVRGRHRFGVSLALEQDFERDEMIHL